MGQQQLLLVILVTIIVGVATVVAINIFGQSMANANIDATRQDVLTLAAQMQGYAIKPTLLGGGNGTFTGVDADKLGFGYDKANSTSKIDFVNGNARFVINASGGTITAYPNQIDDWTTNNMVATVTKNSISFSTTPVK